MLGSGNIRSDPCPITESLHDDAKIWYAPENWRDVAEGTTTNTQIVAESAATAEDLALVKEDADPESAVAPDDEDPSRRSLT